MHQFKLKFPPLKLIDSSSLNQKFILLKKKLMSRSFQAKLLTWTKLLNQPELELRLEDNFTLLQLIKYIFIALEFLLFMNTELALNLQKPMIFKENIEEMIELQLEREEVEITFTELLLIKFITEQQLNLFITLKLLMCRLINYKIRFKIDKKLSIQLFIRPLLEKKFYKLLLENLLPNLFTNIILEKKIFIIFSDLSLKRNL